MPPTTTLDIILPTGLTRSEVKNYVIDKFQSEHPGTGKKELCSKYVYVAENLSNNKRILLKRPAPLNKGMDFTVHVDGIFFRKKRGNRDMPSHHDIITDLQAKLTRDPNCYAQIKIFIKDLFSCKNIEIPKVLESQIDAGVMTTEEAVMAIKWLFIEQDVTYWNWSGRSMLFNCLCELNLC